VGFEIDKTETQTIIVRVGKLSYEDLLGKKSSHLMDFTPMRSFLFVDPEEFDTDKDLDV